MCVLIVEDELLIRMFLAMTLEDAGHEVLCAADGTEALAVAVRSPRRLSAVVTDFHMPGVLTGADVVTNLRKVYPVIPMFIATANPDLVSNDFMQTHDVRVIPKPYEAEELTAVLGGAIRQASA